VPENYSCRGSDALVKPIHVMTNAFYCLCFIQVASTTGRSLARLSSNAEGRGRAELQMAQIVLDRADPTSMDIGAGKSLAMHTLDRRASRSSASETHRAMVRGEAGDAASLSLLLRRLAGIK
jgi:hypothetical protein